MADYVRERDVKFGVFCKNKEWLARSRWYSPQEYNFVGEFTVRCKSRREGVRKAIAAAKASKGETHEEGRRDSSRD